MTEGEGERLKEAGSINRSLTSLGLVIKKLVEGSGPAAPASQPAHIPYRDSRLTFLLQVFRAHFTLPLAALCCSVLLRAAIWLPEWVHTRFWEHLNGFGVSGFC